MYKDFKVVSEVVVPGVDPFADLDAESRDVVDHGHSSDDDMVELTRLVERVCEDPPDLEMYLNFDQDIVCQQFDDDKWNDEFFAELDRTQEGATCKERRLQEDEATCSSDEEEPVQPTIKTTSEALQLHEQTQYFLDFFGHGYVANYVGVVIDKVVALQMKQLMNAKQSHIDDCFL